MFGLKFCRPAILAMAGLLLAGCAQFKIPLSESEIETLKVSGVDVAYAERSKVHWPRAMRENRAQYEETLSVPLEETESAENDADVPTDVTFRFTDEDRAYARAALQEAIVERVGTTFSERPAGNRNVVIKIDVRQFNIVSPPMQLLGATHLMVADVSLIEEESGQVLAPPRLVAINGNGNDGFGGLFIDLFGDRPSDQMIGAFDLRLRKWMFPRVMTEAEKIRAARTEY